MIRENLVWWEPQVCQVCQVPTGRKVTEVRREIEET